MIGTTADIGAGLTNLGKSLEKAAKTLSRGRVEAALLQRDTNVTYQQVRSTTSFTR